MYISTRRILATGRGSSTAASLLEGDYLTKSDGDVLTTGDGTFLTSGATYYTPTDLLISNLEVAAGAANGTLIGYLYAVDENPRETHTFSIDSSTYCEITAGNRLQVKADSTGQSSETFNITVTDSSGLTYVESVTVTFTAVSNGSGLSDGDIVADGGWTVDPKTQGTNDGFKFSGKTGGVAKFVFDIGVPDNGGVYTMSMEADYTGLKNTGKDTFFGWGLKQDSDIHFVGLKGDGNVPTVMDNYKIYGANLFNKKSGFTESDGGAATNGTKDGPNWYRLTVSNDGSTYTFATSADGNTWDNEYSASSPTPLSSVTDATEFGPALFIPDSDKGTPQLTITVWTETVNTISFVDSGGTTSSSTPITVSLPAGAQAGDLGVVLWMAAGDTTNIAKSGWTTRKAADNGILAKGSIVTGVLTASDISAGNISFTGPSGVFNWSAMVLVFRTNVAITSVSAASGGGEVTSGDPSQQTIAAGTSPSIYLAFAGEDSFTNPTLTASGMTQVTEGLWMTGGYRLWNRGTTQSAQNADMGNIGSSNTLLSVRLDIS